VGVITLKDLIPKEWRSVVKKMSIPEETINFKEQVHVTIGKHPKNINLITNKEIYWTFVNDIRVESIIMDKLQRELNLNEDQCKLVFKMPRVITNTKIKAFQFKLLYNLIPCNLYLKRIQKSDTDKCSWCTEVDTTAHYFVSCSSLVPFWNSFTNWCQGMLDEEINFTVEDVLVGILTNKNDTINACLLLAKWHIYKSKLNQSNPFFYKFLCELKYYINIEKSILYKNNKIVEYFERWGKVENFLT
jgi:hypothetical protein